MTKYIIDDVLPKLGNVRKSGNRYVACCPAHDDHNPSLSISEGTDGTLLLKCFRGCTFEQIVTAIGLNRADDYSRAKTFSRGSYSPRGRQKPQHDFRRVTTDMLFRFVDDDLEERCGIAEYDGGMTRQQAEAQVITEYPDAEYLRLYRVCVNDAVRNKTTNYAALTTGFKNQTLTGIEIANIVRSGYAVVFGRLRELDSDGSTRRCSENWTGSELFAVDVDSGLSLDEAMKYPATARALFIYTTASHTEEHNRYRVVFALPHFETDAERYRATVQAYGKLYGADQQATDVARGFYGNDSARVWMNTIHGGRWL